MRALGQLNDEKVAYQIGQLVAAELRAVNIHMNLAPVLDVDGEILADFGPDQLADFWRKLEKKDAQVQSR